MRRNGDVSNEEASMRGGREMGVIVGLRADRSFELILVFMQKIANAYISLYVDISSNRIKT